MSARSSWHRKGLSWIEKRIEWREVNKTVSTHHLHSEAIVTVSVSKSPTVPWGRDVELVAESIS